MKNSSFHKTNLGAFGESLPCDLNGYVHTTIIGWMTAPLDAMTWRGYSASAKRDRCREMAQEAREAIKRANADLAEWRAES